MTLHHVGHYVPDPQCIDALERQHVFASLHVHSHASPALCLTCTDDRGQVSIRAGDVLSRGDSREFGVWCHQHPSMSVSSRVFFGSRICMNLPRLSAAVGSLSMPISRSFDVNSG